MSEFVILQKQLASTYRGTEYFKYRINLPIRIVRKLDLKKGDVLYVSIDGNKIILQK
ncbi:MAG: AbrB/MazE/SpoVT family DNA-binding domain-containing protein [Thaumarchaeota archaeon]|nr:AbrB/MazE/SpoVT family DNA-binding domain-containing protein [Nitrososphaerota archaeon]